jgi:hypothetical protein
MIYCFGDSWSYGSGLNENENPFVYWLSKDLGIKFVNYSSEGNSYPKIVSQIFDNIHKINNKDIVLIVIPPDIRWMDQEDEHFIPWWVDLDKERYMSWLGDKTEVWFRYHASLFTYTIQSALDSIGCKYLFMHNYGGEFTIDNRFKFLINIDNFLDIKRSLTTILGGEDSYESWDLKKDGPSERKYGIFFGEEDRRHPNELGHKRIAELIKEKI